MVSRISPLHEVHLESGAMMTDFAGWDMPLRFVSDRVEHEAVRTRAGLFDLSHMAQIDTEGPQAGQAIDNSVVSHCSALATGKAKYTMVVDADGGILDDLIVYKLAQDHYLTIANAANAQVVLDAFTVRSQGMDAAVVDRTEARSLIALQGPAARDILAAVTDIDLDAIKYYSIHPATVCSVPALLARTGYTGEDGFELSVAANYAVRLWRDLLAAGSAQGAIPCGLAARDSLRLEAGMPLYGHELSPDIAPIDAGMRRLVAFDHEFVGSSALAERERTSWLSGLTGSGRRAARQGCQVYVGEERVGEITSGLLSPTLGYPIAFARTTRALAKGEHVEVDVRGKMLPMTQTPTPFYRR